MLIAKLKVTEYTPAGYKSRWRQKKESTFEGLTFWVNMLQRSSKIESGFIAKLENGKPGKRLYEWTATGFRPMGNKVETFKPYELDLEVNKYIYNKDGTLEGYEEEQIQEGFETLEEATSFAKRIAKTHYITSGNLARMRDATTGERIAYWQEGVFSWYN